MLLDLRTMNNSKDTLTCILLFTWLELLRVVHCSREVRLSTMACKSCMQLVCVKIIRTFQTTQWVSVDSMSPRLIECLIGAFLKMASVELNLLVIGFLRSWILLLLSHL